VVWLTKARCKRCSRRKTTKDHHGCPVQATVNLISGKWKVQILWHLSFRPRRFAEMRKKLKTISEKVLTEQLRQLEKDGLVLRHATNSVPPQVTYSLNASGEELVPMLQTLCDWGCTHLHMKPSLPRHP
jgi:DNA-binding HxlR family transcriptional regulator